MLKFGLFLLQGIPESIGVIGLSLALARIPLRWRLILVIGTVMTLIIYLIRLLPITFGLHTVAAMLLFVLSIIKTTKVPATSIFLAVFASFALLAILETAIFEVFLFFTKMDPREVTSNELLWQELGIPQDFLLIFFALIVARLKRPISDAWKQWQA